MRDFLPGGCPNPATPAPQVRSHARHHAKVILTMARKPNTSFERELWHMIRKHLGAPQRMSDYFPIMDALDEASARLALDADKQFPSGVSLPNPWTASLRQRR
jgi:hypothetical protein